MIVYLDLLIFINLVFNLILLTMAGWMALQRFHFKRYALAAIAGTVFGLIFFFNPQYIFIDWLCRIAGGLAMTYIAWKPGDLRGLITKTVMLVVSGQLLGGGIFSLAFALDSTSLTSPSPGSISLAIVCGGGVLFLPLAAWWVGRMHSNKQLKCYVGTVSIWLSGRNITLPALLDSGNTLRHPVNSWPVVIIERQGARQLLSEETLAWLDNPLSTPPIGLETRIGLIPFKSVGGAGMLAAVRPDRLVISCELGHKVLTQVYVCVRQKSDRPLDQQALAFPVDNWEEGDIV